MANHRYRYNEVVLQVQSVLYLAGYTEVGRIDGVLGGGKSNTNKAIARYMNENGLAQDTGPDAMLDHLKDRLLQDKDFAKTVSDAVVEAVYRHNGESFSKDNYDVRAAEGFMRLMGMKNIDDILLVDVSGDVGKNLRNAIKEYKSTAFYGQTEGMRIESAFNKIAQALHEDPATFAERIKQDYPLNREPEGLEHYGPYAPGYERARLEEMGQKFRSSMEKAGLKLESIRDFTIAADRDKDFGKLSDLEVGGILEKFLENHADMQDTPQDESMSENKNTPGPALLDPFKR